MFHEIFSSIVNSLQWRIQDFPRGGAPTPKIAIIFHIFAENCMKMKKFGPRGGRVPGAPLGSANGLQKQVDQILGNRVKIKIWITESPKNSSQIQMW